MVSPRCVNVPRVRWELQTQPIRGMQTYSWGSSSVHHHVNSVHFNDGIDSVSICAVYARKSSSANTRVREQLIDTLRRQVAGRRLTLIYSVDSAQRASPVSHTRTTERVNVVPTCCAVLTRAGSTLVDVNGAVLITGTVLIATCTGACVAVDSHSRTSCSAICTSGTV